MEYFIPYARLKPIASNGMQLTNVKRTEHDSSMEMIDSMAITNVNSGKKIKKLVQNEQFKQLKSSAEIEFPSAKMSKKQLKVAQDQLKKLTKINIHLSGGLHFEYPLLFVVAK